MTNVKILSLSEDIGILSVPEKYISEMKKDEYVIYQEPREGTDNHTVVVRINDMIGDTIAKQRYIH